MCTTIEKPINNLYSPYIDINKDQLLVNISIPRGYRINIMPLIQGATDAIQVSIHPKRPSLVITTINRYFIARAINRTAHIIHKISIPVRKFIHR